MNADAAIPHHPVLICDACFLSSKIFAALFWPCRSIQISYCSMLSYPLHPAIWRSVVHVADLCRSVLIHPTLQWMATLHATCDALCLYVLLLTYMCCFVPIRDTENWPDNNEELISNSKITDEYIQIQDNLP